MKYAILPVLMFVGISLLSHAEVENLSVPLDWKGKRYEGASKITFHTLVQALERTQPVVESKDLPDPPKNSAPIGDSPAEISKAHESLRGEMVQVFRTNQEVMRDRLKSRQATPPVGETTKDAPAAPREPERVPALSRETLARFYRCAEQTLPLFKQLLRYRLTGNFRGAGEIEILLQPERGNGSIVSHDGLFCGKHLGAWGVVNSTGAQEELQTVSALLKSRRDSSEIWRFYGLYQRTLSGQSVRTPDFWVYAWRRLSFHRIFSNRPLPSRADLTQEFMVSLGSGPLSVNEKQQMRFEPNITRYREIIEQDWRDYQSESLIRIVDGR